MPTRLLHRRRPGTEPLAAALGARRAGAEASDGTDSTSRRLSLCGRGVRGSVTSVPARAREGQSGTVVSHSSAEGGACRWPNQTPGDCPFRASMRGLGEAPGMRKPA